MRSIEKYLLVIDIDKSCPELNTILSYKGIFWRKWPLTFDFGSRSLNLKRKIGNITFLVILGSTECIYYSCQKLTSDANKS